MGTVCQYSSGRTEFIQVLLNMYTMCMQTALSVHAVTARIVPVGENQLLNFCLFCKLNYLVVTPTLG